MRNIIIIASICFFTGCLASYNYLEEEDCRELCNSLPNSFNDVIYGFVIRGVCHCMRALTPTLTEINQKSCTQACIEKNINYNLTPIYGRDGYIHEGLTDCTCFAYLNCTTDYCDNFCKKTHTGDDDRYYNSGYCENGYKCTCSDRIYNDCTSRNKTSLVEQCQTLNSQITNKVLTEITEYFNNFILQPKEDHGYVMNICPPVTVTIANNTNTIICGNGTTPVVPKPEPDCNTCECNCTRKMDCQNCFECYEHGGHSHACRHVNNHCEKCLTCVHDCPKSDRLKICGCSLMCYTHFEPDFKPIVYQRKNKL